MAAKKIAASDRTVPMFDADVSSKQHSEKPAYVAASKQVASQKTKLGGLKMGIKEDRVWIRRYAHDFACTIEFWISFEELEELTILADNIRSKR